MAKTKGPLFSLEAHGTIGKEITFSQRKSGSQVRYQKKQKDYESADRQTQRNAYRYGIELWNSLTPTEKAYWNEIASVGYATI